MYADCLCQAQGRRCVQCRRQQGHRPQTGPQCESQDQGELHARANTRDVVEPGADPIPHDHAQQVCTLTTGKCRRSKPGGGESRWGAGRTWLVNTSTFKDETTLRRAALTLDQGGGRLRCLAVQGLLRVFQIIVGVVEGDKVAEGPLAAAPGRWAHTRIRSTCASRTAAAGSAAHPARNPADTAPVLPNHVLPVSVL